MADFFYEIGHLLFEHFAAQLFIQIIISNNSMLRVLLE
jgi:hypothetical protein